MPEKSIYGFFFPDLLINITKRDIILIHLHCTQDINDKGKSIIFHLQVTVKHPVVTNAGDSIHCLFQPTDFRGNK